MTEDSFQQTGTLGWSETQSEEQFVKTLPRIALQVVLKILLSFYV